MKDDPEIIEAIQIRPLDGAMCLFVTRRGVTEIQQRVPMRERVPVPRAEDEFWRDR